MKALRDAAIALLEKRFGIELAILFCIVLFLSPYSVCRVVSAVVFCIIVWLTIHKVRRLHKATETLAAKVDTVDLRLLAAEEALLTKDERREFKERLAQQDDKRKKVRVPGW